MIRLDLCSIAHIYQDNKNLTRTEHIQAKKTAIYAFRRQLLSDILNKDISSDCIIKTAYGKPILKNQPFGFNHSHSQDMYVLASSHEQHNIGIDIENTTRKIRFDALAKHAFHAEEYEHWLALNQDIKFWFNVWTTKEAILKANGLGIRLDLKSLNTKMPEQHTEMPINHIDKSKYDIDYQLVTDERLGNFAYKNIHVGQSVLTVAWQLAEDLKRFSSKAMTIELIQHDVNV